MIRLVEISGGTWVDPDDVRRVYWRGGATAQIGWFDKIEIEATSPSVVVVCRDGQELSWNVKTRDEAHALADQMAAIINGVDDPDDPEREDIPEPVPGDNVVAFAKEGTNG